MLVCYPSPDGDATLRTVVQAQGNALRDNTPYNFLKFLDNDNIRNDIWHVGAGFGREI
jgi:hypothetical protein